jgi:lipoprotein NlpD
MRDVNTRKPLRYFTVALVAIVCVACGSDPPRPSGSYVVKKGDTLYSIAWRNGLDYRELARWNGIGRDYAIKPGQVLRLTKSGATPVASTSSPPARRAPVQSAGPPMKWSWPAIGHSVTLTSRPNGGEGLTIGGTLGMDIRAAAAGRVVYTGTGLLGYGQLVIIKHNDTYLSAYGHTQAVRVREQDPVQAGQPIATMGAGPNGAPMLYFEIRVNGVPVDPTPMLPK